MKPQVRCACPTCTADRFVSRAFRVFILAAAVYFAAQMIRPFF